jgi:hypothetical protein
MILAQRAGHGALGPSIFGFGDVNGKSIEPILAYDDVGSRPRLFSVRLGAHLGPLRAGRKRSFATETSYD